ncbi:MAG: hypothetical protein ACI8RD_007031 [Bacillariaceae sp.]|jgi:hypothetical protein
MVKERRRKEKKGTVLRLQVVFICIIIHITNDEPWLIQPKKQLYPGAIVKKRKLKHGVLYYIYYIVLYLVFKF